MSAGLLIGKWTMCGLHCADNICARVEISLNELREYNRAHRGHYACIESVVVQPTNTLFVIANKTPEEERSDGEWVVATE